jgi:hypothetical protein
LDPDIHPISTKEAVVALKTLDVGDGKVIYVEVEFEQIPLVSGTRDNNKPTDLPSGGEATGFAEKAENALAALTRSVQAVAAQVHAGIADSPATEWSIELKFGFAGESNVIPFIMSGKGDAALKVNVKWARSATKKETSTKPSVESSGIEAETQNS